MKTLESAKIIIANAEKRDKAIIAKQGMTGGRVEFTAYQQHEHVNRIDC